MATASNESVAGRPGAGWAELKSGGWAAAREIFEREVAERPTAEAYEGLSWSAWWVDDADGVFAARERAHALYRRRGDRTGAARMATWLAADHLDFHGAHALAAGWLRRAARLLRGLAPAPEHGWLAFHEGYIAHVGGDPERAAELGADAARLGRRFGVADLEMLGLALEGSALVALGRVDEGTRCLDEAAAAALGGEAEIPMSFAWTCCFLVVAWCSARDFGRAFEWCDRIAAFADRYGSRYMLAFCRAEYGELYLWRGRWDDAEDVLVAAVDDFSHSRPALVSGALAALAELRRRQGRDGEAEQLLDRCEAAPAALACRARLALDRGDVVDALDHVDRVLRRLPARGLGRVPALEVAVRAHSAHGDHGEAARAAAALREIAAAAGTGALSAGADLAAGLVESAAGRYDDARPLLEDAADGFERSGAPYEAAQARGELARVLPALGRARAAAREAEAAQRALDRLGAAAGGSGRPALAGVTRREREVLSLLAEGLTNREIAARLVVSEHTVHRHVGNILRKLDLPSRAAAAAHAARAGLT